MKVSEKMVDVHWDALHAYRDVVSSEDARRALAAAVEPLPEPTEAQAEQQRSTTLSWGLVGANARIAELEAQIAAMPEPGSTIIELNKRVRALQILLERARKAGFDVGDEP